MKYEVLSMKYEWAAELCCMAIYTSYFILHTSYLILHTYLTLLRNTHTRSIVQ